MFLLYMQVVAEEVIPEAQRRGEIDITTRLSCSGLQ